MTITLDGTNGITVGNSVVNATTITVGNASVNSQGFAISGSKLAQLDALAHNNIVVNGEMRISQLNGNTQSNTNTFYPADQWTLGFSGSMVANTYQSTDAPSGYNNSMLASVTTANTVPAAGDYTICEERLEGYRITRLGWGTGSAVNATLGFWAKSSLVGTFCTSIRNAAVTFSWVATFTITSASTWQWFTFSVPAQPSGTWLTDNSVAATFDITLCCGSTRIASAPGWSAGNFVSYAQTNFMATAGATFQVTGVVLLAGDYTIASSEAKFIQRPNDDELLICQRYWQAFQSILLAHVGPGTLGSYGGCVECGPLFPNVRIASCLTPTSTANGGGWSGTLQKQNTTIDWQIWSTSTQSANGAYNFVNCVCDARL